MCDKSFTEQEIRDAFNRLSWMPRTADTLVRNIIDNREPEWKDGDVVRDKYGKVWRRSVYGWDTFGSTVVAPDSAPKRPLKKIG